MQQLPLDTTHYVCGMDNLFISPKFAKVMYNDSGKKIMIHGVCRVRHGVPKCIIQDVVTKKEDLLSKKGL